MSSVVSGSRPTDSCTQRDYRDERPLQWRVHSSTLAYKKIAAPSKIRKNEWSRSSRNVQKIRDYIICSDHRTFLFSNFLNDFVPKTFCFLNISECGRFGH